MTFVWLSPQTEIVQLAASALVPGLCDGLRSIAGPAWHLAVAVVQTPVEIAPPLSLSVILNTNHVHVMQQCFY